jgi:hypothetical protein
MGLYDGFGDTPKQIRSEGQQIDVAFVRNGDGTGTIKWNIPSPVAGCSAEDQAYDGIVIIVSDKPANYIESSPKDGKYYEADPTFDPDMHVGDKIDDARVVGAFYHDKTTSNLIVQDVKDKTPYYVSAYAVDDVARYHREGVHAYSLPTGEHEWNEDEDTRAMHDIGLDIDIIHNGTPTGLVSGTDYTFKVQITGEEYELTIEGHDAPTYPDLVKAINAEFVRITDAPRKNLNLETCFYFDEETKKLYGWDFDKYVELPVIVDEEDPTIPVLGTYWYDGENVYEYESGGWTQLELILQSFDPTNPQCDTIWFDGVTARKWELTHWCELPTFIQDRNPLLPRVMTCDDYWYNEETGTTLGWDTDIDGWKEVDVIYSDQDPNTLAPGDFWYDQTNEIMFIRDPGSTWGTLTAISYEEPDADGNFVGTPVPALYWYIPSQQVFYQRNTNNTDWIEIDFTLAPTDPTERESCDLWWNSSVSVDDLYTWDKINSSWILVNSFTQGTVDPSTPPTLPEGATWYNPFTGELTVLTGSDCKFKNVEYINYPTDPRDLGANVAWLNSEGEIRISDGLSNWTLVDPIHAPTDPYIVPEGTYWYDEDDGDGILKKWNGAGWENQVLKDSLVFPKEGEIFLNDVDEKLYVWDGTTWVETNAIAGVELIAPNKPNQKNRLCFFTYARGCDQYIEVIVEAENLFTQLSNTVMYFDPIPGGSRLEKGQTWNQLGIGDDGSPDERREMHTLIRQRLGAPSQRVELTDDQIDEALNSALLMIRKYSGYGYDRELFFMDLKPNQQKYLMTNRCVGFNKIVTINNLWRLRSGFLNGNLGAGGYDVFGYAALLHLYKTGTFDTLSFHLVSSYIEDMQMLFADHLTYNFIEEKRELHLYHAVYTNERILIDAFIEKPEQWLFTNRDTRSWIKKWAVAESKMMLSQIRGKFQTLPGPNGSTTLNSQELITQAETEKAELIQELEDPGMQNLEQVGGAGHFIMG